MITAFGTYDAARHPRIKVLIDGLRSAGHPVWEVNEPLGLSTAEKVRMLHQPWRLPLLLLRLLGCWWRLIRARFELRRRHERPGVVLVGYLGHFDVVLARALFPRCTIVLDHLVFAGDTATDRGARGLRVRALTLLDRVAVACADVVVVDTEEHRRMLPHPSRGVVVPVGAEDRWFAAGDAARRDRDGALTVVFFGLFTPLQGAPTAAEGIARAVDRGADLRVTMIGTGQDHDSARARLADTPGVTWVDWVDAEDLPELVAGHDVCLGIFSSTTKGQRVVPNKVYQGLAAGCVVPTSDTPPQRRMVGDYVELVPPADPAALATLLVELCDRDRLELARARAATGRDAFRPASVARPLLDHLRQRGDLR